MTLKHIPSIPDSSGFFGPYGGQFVPEAAKGVLNDVAAAYAAAKADPKFQQELTHYLTTYVGRPSPTFYCNNLSSSLGGAKIYLKREDLNHLGAHKVNNTVGQVLLAKRMGKKKVIAETGAGQHGVATAATAAMLGLECTVYMGKEDIRRQAPNVARMKLTGAKVVPALSGQQTLKEAVDEAITAWLLDIENSFYVLGSAVGPHPYPLMVRDFQTIIGVEAKEQMLAQHGSLPDICIACVGGGSNAIGLFHPFINDTQVRLIGVEPGGVGAAPGQHAASLNYGTPGVLHGFNSYLLQDAHGEAAQVYSISAGLDYPGVSPEHAILKDTGRAEYVTITDAEAIAAFSLLCKKEGIIPALESAHALAHALKIAPTLDKSKAILVNLSGRGDKDMPQLEHILNLA